LRLSAPSDDGTARRRRNRQPVEHRRGRVLPDYVVVGASKAALEAITRYLPMNWPR